MSSLWIACPRKVLATDISTIARKIKVGYSAMYVCLTFRSCATETALWSQRGTNMKPRWPIVVPASSTLPLNKGVGFPFLFYIVGSEQENVKCDFCQNWVTDAIIFTASKSIWEKIAMSKFELFPYFLRGQKVFHLTLNGTGRFPSEQEHVRCSWRCVCRRAQTSGWQQE